MTVWYDFTTTLRNTGRNGIAAVEWNIGTALLEAETDVRCFALRDRRGLTEVDPCTDLRTAFYASASSIAERLVTTSLPTWRSKARAAMVPLLGRYADPVVAAMARVYRWPSLARRSVNRSLNRTLSAARRPALADRVGATDTVVSAGADWSGDLLERLMDLKRRTGCRVVTMVYDMIPLTHSHLAFHNEPELFAAYYARLTTVSDVVLCISEQSRQDLIGLAAQRDWPLSDTAVLRLGETRPDYEEAVAREDFYLWVGTVERRKNLELIYDALRIIESEGGEVPRVIVAGALGWGVDDLVAELDLQSTAASRAIVLLGPVDEETLDNLYRRARALLFPSHYEGWGLPVREAAVRGCPVAAGDSPAVREALAGYAAGRLLPVDDPGPWAEYLCGSSEPTAEPVPVHTWSAVASQLMRLVSGKA